MTRASSVRDLPDDSTITAWLAAAMDAAGMARDVPAEVAVRIVDEDEGRDLNSRYRGRDYATNVLSFPAGDAMSLPDDEPQPLGDLVLCAPVVVREAAEQGKRVADHWGHLLVHGLLHLLGHDHESDADAQAMETIEIAVLAARGVGNPYAGGETG